MIAVLFKRELKRNFKSFAAATIICGVMAAYIVSMSTSMGQDIQVILDVKLPKSLQAAFGMGGLDFSNAGNVFALSFSYIYLFISIFYANVFAAIVSKEFSDKTAEYLFSLPVKRLQIILTKLSVAVMYAVLCIVVVFLLSWLSFEMNVFSGYDLGLVSMMSLAWLIGGLFFGSVAFLISSFSAGSRTISFVAIGFVMAMYILQIVVALNPNIGFVKYFSPFDWFKGADIVQTGNLSLTYSLIAICSTLVFTFLGIRRYLKMEVLI